MQFKKTLCPRCHGEGRVLVERNGKLVFIECEFCCTRGQVKVLSEKERE
jgi:transcription elongation factor Elf1